MEYTLIDIMADIQTREPVTIKVKDPGNWEQVHDITGAIRRKMLELMNLTKQGVPGELDVRISCMPPEDGGSGRVFYVKPDMFVMLKPLFAGIVWNCIHTEIGDELD